MGQAEVVEVAQQLGKTPAQVDYKQGHCYQKLAL